MDAMKAVVVYESHWGNTQAIARAVAAGFGADAEALTTDQASAAALLDADLLVVGAPLIAFGLPSDKMRAGIAAETNMAPSPPDLSHPSLSSWLRGLPRGHGLSASFETRIRWSPGGATGAIDRGLKDAGYRSIGKGRRFIVAGKYGPLRDGEIELARQWGAELAAAIRP
jgi:Flavodoxin